MLPTVAYAKLRFELPQMNLVEQFTPWLTFMTIYEPHKDTEMILFTVEFAVLFLQRVKLLKF